MEEEILALKATVSAHTALLSVVLRLMVAKGQFAQAEGITIFTAAQHQINGARGMPQDQENLAILTLEQIAEAIGLGHP